MFEYGKTENIFARDDETKKLIGVFRVPEVGLIDPGQWIATEKIDGTNVRLTIVPAEDGGDYEIFGSFQTILKGRSDAATLPKGLAWEMPIETQDNPGVLTELYEALELPPHTVVTFYGEAYGAGIQKGGIYSSEKRIRVFDLVTSRPRLIRGEWSHSWRPYSQLLEAARIVGLTPVPELPRMSLEGYLAAVAHGFSTRITDEGGTGGEAEGVVIRTDPYVYNFRGSRVFAKIKTRDFQ